MKVRIKGTNTMYFIKKEELPQNLFREITYSRVVYDVREVKADKNRTMSTVIGDRIKYPGDCGTPTADLITLKLLLNSIISTLGAKSMKLYIKSFYLNTTLA